MSKEARKLANEWVEENELIIRRPSDDEQRAGKIQTSDYQISSLTIQTKILSTLELIDRVYRTKNTTVEASNGNKIRKYKTIINKLFFNIRHIDNMQDFYITLSEDKNLSDEMGFDIKNYLKSIKSWEKVLDNDNIIPSIAAFVKTESEEGSYTEEEVTLCKERCVKIINYFEKQKEIYENPTLCFTALSHLSSFRTIIKDEIFFDIFNTLLDFDGSIEEYKELIFNYLDNKNKGSIKKHTQTLVNEMCLKSQSEILNKIISDGIGEKLTLKNYVEYLIKYSPHIIPQFKTEIGISLMDYDNFNDLCEALYSPEIIKNIRQNLDVKIRPRVSGDIRKGSELIIEQKRFNAKCESAKKKLGDEINNYNPENENYITKIKHNLYLEKRKDINTKKTLINKLKIELKKCRRNRDVSESQRLKLTIRDEEHKLRELTKICKVLKKDYINQKNKTKSKNRAYEIYKQYKQKELDMFRDMKDERKSEDLYELNILEQQIKNNNLKEDFIPYFTWKFVCREMDINTADNICETLEKYLNEGNGICGESGYINASSYLTTYEGENVIEFYIDYPKSAAIYKAFNKKKNLSEILLNGFSDCLNKDIKYISELTIFNIPMEKTLIEKDEEESYWN